MYTELSIYKIITPTSRKSLTFPLLIKKKNENEKNLRIPSFYTGKLIRGLRYYSINSLVPLPSSNKRACKQRTKTKATDNFPGEGKGCCAVREKSKQNELKMSLACSPLVQREKECLLTGYSYTHTHTYTDRKRVHRDVLVVG